MVKRLLLMACCLLTALCRVQTTCRGSQHSRTFSRPAACWLGRGEGLARQNHEPRGRRRRPCTLLFIPSPWVVTDRRPLSGGGEPARGRADIRGRGRTKKQQGEPPRSTEVRDVSELKRLSDYFQREGKDNSTVYFYASEDYGSVWEAVEREVSAMMMANNLTTTTAMTAERARNLHEIGAVYRLGDKFRRTSEVGQGGPVTKGDGFRVYLYPRTFPGCYAGDYADRVAYEDEDWIIVDKPPGCPCSPHVSNKLDCLDVALGATLRKPGLIRLNRLDTVTSGLVTIGKSGKGATAFQEEMRRQRIHKVYRALLEGPVPVGPLKHYMAPDIIHRRPAPRAISNVQHEGWKAADARVLSCTPIPVAQLCLDPEESQGLDVCYEVEVELITGRTHQLRAQFAALHAPIVADDMYKPMSGYLLNDLEDPVIHGLYPICVEPKGRHGVALQCYRLRFLHLDVTAGDPWWRRRG